MKSFYPLSLLILVFSFAACSTTDLTTDSTAAHENWEWIATPSWYDHTEYDTVSVVTWNVEHFVDEYDNPYIDNDRENSPEDDLAERRKLLAEALIDLDADIVVFQEIESAAYVESIAEEYLAEMGYRYFTSRESNDWYMNVVVMSRIPLGILYSYANPYTYIVGEEDDDGGPSIQNLTNNRMLSVDVHVNPNYRFLLSGLHLKAGRGDRNAGWRIGQINLLREHYGRISSINHDARILVTGDLNTIPGDPEFEQLLGNEESRVQFIDPLADVQSYTHTADDPQRQLDHILPNRPMMQDLVPGSATIPMPFDAETMRFISDHLPVMAKFVTTVN
ncbi:endonuclease/exonuclease/phosphatase family protein [Rhodohalobacter sp. 8-1]|uniref:endonuclease/exonuclease/phosphatase family protein n=1 Tax=Rhodohalobacter sp. 8-1 TaxID=3131972 RepID=UPI0030EF319C